MRGYRYVIQRTAIRGDPVGFWEPDVPRVGDAFLNSVVSLYKDEAAAREGKGAGGSGFLVGVPWTDGSQLWHYYFVTNKHVIEKGGLAVRVNIAPDAVVRLTDNPGAPVGPTRFHVETTPEDQWKKHEKCDLAVYLVDAPSYWNLAAVSISSALTAEQDEELRIGVGDDVLVAARFVGRDGTFGNTPVLHTGTIAMTPGAPVPNRETGQDERCWIIETHARSGYSGSPVYGYISPKQVRLGGPDRGDTDIVYLLGLVWAYFTDEYPVLDENGKPLTPRQCVKVWNGLAGVVPALRIRQLLDRRDVVDKRKEAEERWLEENTPKSTAEPAFHDAEPSDLEHTADLMGKLLGVPKDEADEVHHGHEAE